MDAPLNLRGRGSRRAARRVPIPLAYHGTELPRPSNFSPLRNCALSWEALRPGLGGRGGLEGEKVGCAASATLPPPARGPSGAAQRRGRKTESDFCLWFLSESGSGPAEGWVEKLGTLELRAHGSKGGVGAEFQGPGSARNFPKEALPELDGGGAVPSPARGAMLPRAPPDSRCPARDFPRPLPARPLHEPPAPRPGPHSPSAPLSAGPHKCGGRRGPATPPRASRRAGPRRPRARHRCCTWCGPARLRATPRRPYPPAASPAWPTGQMSGAGRGRGRGGARACGRGAPAGAGRTRPGPAPGPRSGRPRAGEGLSGAFRGGSGLPALCAARKLDWRARADGAEGLYGAGPQLGLSLLGFRVGAAGCAKST